MAQSKLYVVKNLLKEITALQVKLQAIDDALKSLVPRNDGLPKSNRHADRYAELTAKKLDAEKELENLLNQLEFSRMELSEQILDSDLDENLKRVLILRYINCLKFQDIAAQMNFSEMHCYTLHRQAVKEFSDI